MLPLGMGIMFRSIGMATSIPLIVLIFNIIIIKTREEKRLGESFGQEYHEYKKTTPFLIPRPKKVISALITWRSGYIGLVIVPILALALLYGLVFNYQSSSIPLQREITDGFFLLICISGILAGQYPKQISGLINRRGSTRSENVTDYQGHHPSCEAFSNHVLRLSGRVYCSGCIGLIIGGVLAILLTLLKYTLITEATALPFFLLGYMLLLLGLFQHLIDLNIPLIHTALNILLVFGVALVRSATQLLNGGIIVDAYILILSLYLVIARIELSRNDHEGICHLCGKDCNLSYSKHRP